uniref:DUF4224 domain-containing protein n=1 Tax=Heterorhabditis bacteriophora TaxID=37862 RepID=A0A1I7WKD5_HETBA
MTSRVLNGALYQRPRTSLADSLIVINSEGRQTMRPQF